jgi:hypothetical protein
MSQWYSQQKETMNKNNEMFSTPLKRISEIVCPSAPIKYKLNEVVIDDGDLHEIVIHNVQRRLIF